jgi:hypothetical protein
VTVTVNHIPTISGEYKVQSTPYLLVTGGRVPVNLNPSSAKLCSPPDVREALISATMSAVATATPGRPFSSSTVRFASPVTHVLGRDPLKPFTSSSMSLVNAGKPPQLGGSTRPAPQQKVMFFRLSSLKLAREDQVEGGVPVMTQLLRERRSRDAKPDQFVGKLTAGVVA